MNNDLISREALKENIDKFIGYLDEDMIYRIKVVIDNAPTVAVNCKDCDGYEAGYSAGLKDAERPRGKFIDIGNTGACNFCSVCKEFILSTHYNFCPNCGAQMKTRTDAD